MSLEFKCLKCSHRELELVETNAVISSKVVDIDEDGFFEYEQIGCDGSVIDRYQCYKCGFILKDENDESITDEEEVVEWLKKNCCQDKKSS